MQTQTYSQRPIKTQALSKSPTHEQTVKTELLRIDFINQKFVTAVSAYEFQNELIEQVTLSSFDEIERLGLMLGDKVLIDTSCKTQHKISRVAIEERTDKVQSIPAITHCSRCKTRIHRLEGNPDFTCSCPMD